MRPNRVKHKLARGKAATVVTGEMTSDLVEVFGSLGFDGVWIKGEHGPIDFGDIGECDCGPSHRTDRRCRSCPGHHRNQYDGGGVCRKRCQISQHQLHPMVNFKRRKLFVEFRRIR